jgi:hypothetical protein
VTATPAVGDVLGTHGLDVVDATREGYLYAWKTNGTDTGVVQWESFHHDNANTGNYATKLDQGVPMIGGTSIIDCDAPPPPPAAAPTYAPTSIAGCACAEAGVGQSAAPRNHYAWGVGWLIGCVLLARRNLFERRKTKE